MLKVFEEVEYKGYTYQITQDDVIVRNKKGKIKGRFATEDDAIDYINDRVEDYEEVQDNDLKLSNNQKYKQLLKELKKKLGIYSGVNHNMIIGTSKLWKPIIKELESKYGCKIHYKKYYEYGNTSESYWYINNIIMREEY